MNDIAFYVTRALFDEIWDALRAVEVIAVPEGFEVAFYTEGPFTDEMEDSASCVVTEFLADLDPMIQVSHRLIEVGARDSISFQSGYVVFLRRTCEGLAPSVVNISDFKPEKFASREDVAFGRLVVATAWALLGEIWLGVTTVRVVVEGFVATIVLYEDGAQEASMDDAVEAISRRLASLLPDGMTVLLRRTQVKAHAESDDLRDKGVVAFSRYVPSGGMDS